jgi:indolepyruvate ferredoxin oxidoreductase alpha subunit
LKLATTYPLPAKLIRKFSAEVDRVIVVEEIDPYLEEEIRILGIEVSGKDFIPLIGELNVEIVEAAAIRAGLIPASTTTVKDIPPIKLPPRRPQLCAGCPHVGPEIVLRNIARDPKIKPSAESRPLSEGEVVVTSDIGCYTLGVYEPLGALDTCACMGASIGQAIGLEKAGIPNKAVAVLGDSTFMHSGITGLADMVYKQSISTVVILDNSTTAMTGHQGHPGNGISIRGEQGPKVDIQKLCEGIGINDVKVVNCYDLTQIESALKAAIAAKEPSVVIARGPCVLKEKVRWTPRMIDKDLCVECEDCLDVGCPAICIIDGMVQIDAAACVGCGVCEQVCPHEAIAEMKS